MKSSAAEHALAPLSSDDDDLEAANFAFDSPTRVAGLPFRFPVEDLRHPLGLAVRKLLENPDAVTVGGIPRSELVVDRLLEEGTALTDAERGELLAIPLGLVDSRGPRCAAKVRRRGLLVRKAELARRLAEDPDDVGLRREDRRVLDELDEIADFLEDPDGRHGAGAPRSRVDRWRHALIRGGEVDPLSRATCLVRDMIAAGYVGQVVGTSGTLKTQLCLELAATFAEGGDFLGRPVRDGRALHIFAEGPGGAPARLAAIYKRHPRLSRGDLVALALPVLFDRAEESAAFADFVVEHLVRDHSKPLRMIAIDTYGQSIEGSANDDDVLAGFERGLRDLLSRIEQVQGEPAFGLIAHHPGHGDQRRGRGSSAQLGNLDFLWVVAPRVSDFKALPLGERIFDVTVIKAKDFEDGWSFSYRAGLEDLGLDGEGYPVRAPVVELLSDDEAIATRAAAAVAGSALPPSARHLVELVMRIERRDGRVLIPREVLAESGYLDDVAARGFDPALNVYGIRANALQEMVYAEDPKVRTGADGTRTVDEAARKRWERSRNALTNSGAARIFDGWLWLAHDSRRTGADGE